MSQKDPGSSPLTPVLSHGDLREHETVFFIFSFNLCERSLVYLLALTHQGTVVLLEIVNYVCLRKCQCFLKQNNRTGKDLAVLFITQVAGRQNDAFIIMSRFKETNDCYTM